MQITMRKTIFMLLIMSGSACTAIRNDLNKQARWGTGSEALTRKVDEKENSGAINAFLWRAALDQLSGTPLDTVSPLTGLIVTDWHSAPGHPADRVRTTVQILGADLRPDTMRVSLERQIQSEGNWIDAPALSSAARSLEETILTKAKDARRTSLGE